MHADAFSYLHSSAADALVLPFCFLSNPGDELIKILAILSFGMCATLLFTAYTTVFIRNLVNTPNKEVPKVRAKHLNSLILP